MGVRSEYVCHNPYRNQTSYEEGRRPSNFNLNHALGELLIAAGVLTDGRTFECTGGMKWSDRMT